MLSRVEKLIAVAILIGSMAACGDSSIADDAREALARLNGNAPGSTTTIREDGGLYTIALAEVYIPDDPAIWVVDDRPQRLLSMKGTYCARTDEASCPSDGPWHPIEIHIRVEEVDPTSVSVTKLSGDGAEGFEIQFDCDDPSCVRRDTDQGLDFLEGLTTGEVLQDSYSAELLWPVPDQEGFPCPGDSPCKEMAADFKTILVAARAVGAPERLTRLLDEDDLDEDDNERNAEADVAASESSEDSPGPAQRSLSPLAEDDPATPVIASRADAEAAVTRIARRLSARTLRFDRSVERANQVSNETVRLRSEEVLLEERGLTVLFTECTDDADCRDSGHEPSAMEIISFEKVDASQFRIGSQVSMVYLPCRASATTCTPLVTGDGVLSDMDPAFVACRDETACQETLRDLQGLAEFFYLDSFFDDGGPRPPAPGFDRRSGDAPADNADNVAEVARFVQSLHQSTAGARTLIPADNGLVLRQLITDGVTLAQPGTLRVDRRICLALLAPNVDQPDVCAQPSLLQAYGLTVNLSEADAESVRVQGPAVGTGARGHMVTVRCKSAAGCARLNSGRFPPNLAASINDEFERPIIRIGCQDRAACENASEVLRALIRAVS